MIKKRILIIFYALLLCVTASFAWLSNFEKNYVSDVRIEYSDGALTVANLNFDAYIERSNDDGTFTALGDGENFTFDSKKMVPDAITPFNIKIRNTSSTESRKAKLSVALRIDPEEAKQANILDVIYLEMVAGDGFSGTNMYHIYVRLDEASKVGNTADGEYFFYIYGEGEEIIIPPSTSVDDYVTLNCKFYYDQSATAEYQNKSIQTVAFRLE